MRFSQKRTKDLQNRMEVGTLLIFLLISFSSLALIVQPAKSEPTTIIVPDDFLTIQEAINNATNGDTIFVRNDTYYEHVVVNRSVSLVGEDVGTTIIDGSNTGHVFYIVSDDVRITDLTVKNSGNLSYPDLDAGICLDGRTGCIISGNRFINNGFCGVSLLHSNQNTISHNNFSSEGWGGIHLLESSRNIVSRNMIADKYGGVNGHVSSNYNNITENAISDSTYGMFWHASNFNNFCGNNLSIIAVEGIWLQDQVNYNVIAENSFLNNTVAIRLQGPNYYNTLSGNIITGSEYGIKIESNARFTNITGNTIINSPESNDSWSAGIRLDSGSDTEIGQNIISRNYYGILLYDFSPRVYVYENNITSNEFGLRVASGGSNYLNVSENIIINNQGYGIGVTGFGGASNYATISRNLIANNSDGIALGQYSDYNTILQNNISQNRYGFYIEYSTQNTIWRNNIVDNDQQVYVTTGPVNYWDDGYPAGGNFWSNHSSADLYCGPFQNETGADGIGDQPHLINGDNVDRYPLVDPCPSIHAVSVDVVEPAKIIVGEGFSLTVRVMVNNRGHFSETVNVTVYADAAVLFTFNVTLTNNQTISIMWDTDGFVKGNYTISAHAKQVPGETYVADNVFADAWVIVAMVGDLAGPDGWPDGQCDMRDIGKVARLFGATPVQPMWDSNCDLTGEIIGLPDEKIDMRDVALVASHFGEVDP